MNVHARKKKDPEVPEFHSFGVLRLYVEELKFIIYKLQNG